MICTDDEASGDGLGAPPVVWLPPSAGGQSTRVGQFRQSAHLRPVPPAIRKHR
ncbi:MAG: hypothetical protein WAK82_39345 [Streptosporangiaceae bacterium]